MTTYRITQTQTHPGVVEITVTHVPTGKISLISVVSNDAPLLFQSIEIDDDPASGFTASLN
jgi:hypothetical protein